MLEGVDLSQAFSSRPINPHTVRDGKVVVKETQTKLPSTQDLDKKRKIRMRDTSKTSDTFRPYSDTMSQPIPRSYAQSVGPPVPMNTQTQPNVQLEQALQALRYYKGLVYHRVQIFNFLLFVALGIFLILLLDVFVRLGQSMQ